MSLEVLQRIMEAMSTYISNSNIRESIYEELFPMFQEEEIHEDLRGIDEAYDIVYEKNLGDEDDG